MDSSEKPLKPVKAVLPKKIYNRQQPVSDTNDNCEEPVLRACRKCRDHACHATVRYNRKYNRAKEKLAKQQQQSKAKEVRSNKKMTRINWSQRKFL